MEVGILDTETLDYPSKDFTRRALHALRIGKRLTVKIRAGWRSRILRGEISSMPLSEIEAREAKKYGKRSPSFKAVLLIGPVVTVHLYALSGGYQANIEDDGQLKLSYAR